MVENCAIFGKRALNTAMESNGNTSPIPPPFGLLAGSSEKSGEVGMYKNQLQELAQRSCFNLPSYACIREGPDHAPRFKASVNFNGEIFESPSYCTTLRQAEHSAAEVALGTLSTRGPSRSLTARVLDETGVYKNLLQETAHRAGLNLPVYTTVRSGPGHVPVFTCIVELASMNFSGEPAKTKKQAEKNAAMAAWSALKQMPNSSQTTNKATESNEEQEQVVVARVLSQFKPKEENRPVRQQRDLNQARRRVLLSAYRDTNCASTQNSLLQYPQQWRSMGLLADSFSSVVYPNQHLNQKQDHFLAHLQPPTILKPTSSRDKDSPFLYSPNRSIPVQIRNKTQVQEIPTPLEEHQKDEEEWLNGKPSIEKEPNKANSSSVLKPTPTFQNSFPLHKAPMFHQSNQPTTHIKTPISFPRYLNTGNGYHGYGLAPAVHIRSVIPVCATPPARSSSSSNISKPSLVKESSPPSSVSENHVSTHTEQEEVVTEASSKLNKLQL